MVDKQIIGKRIYQIRLENSLTQDEFAKKLEVNRSAISQIENGIISPSLDLLNKISTVFNTSLDWIINGISGDFFKHYTALSVYAEKLNAKAEGNSRIMLPSNEETIQFLENIIIQKEIELGHSNQILKYLEEKMQSNSMELETLKKLLAILQKQAEENPG